MLYSHIFDSWLGESNVTLPEVPIEDMDGDILELLQCLEPAVQIEAVEQFDVQGVLGHL